MHQKHPFRTRKGDGGFSRGSAGARKGDDGFRQPAQLAYRGWLRRPWAVAGPGRATSGRTTLQTSSNQRNSNRLARTPVTNVVNLSRKTSIFNEKGVGLTTFVTTTQESPQKTPRIDDVCNKTQAGPPNRRPPRGLRGQAAVPVGGGRGLRHPEHQRQHNTSPRHNKTARPQWGRAAVAVALGFEPRVAVTPHSISSAAPSAARTRYLTRILYYTLPLGAQIDRACWEQGHTAA